MKKKQRYRVPRFQDCLPHIDSMVERLKELVQKGNRLDWRVALRRLACEMEDEDRRPKK